MKTEGNLLFNNYNHKPRYLSKYQHIFQELFQDDNTVELDFNKTQTSSRPSYFLIDQTRNSDPIKNSLISTRYQLITGKKLDTKSNKNYYKNNKSNQSYQFSNSKMNGPSFEVKYGNQNLKNFKRFLRETDRNNLKNNNGFNYNTINVNKTRNGNYSNNFIEKLHSALPEYTSLSNKGQSFLKGNLKTAEFSSLKNKLRMNY